MMDGKLIKVESNYVLMVVNTLYAKSDNELPIIDCQKLSPKNCEAIANGYDLDELACDECGIAISAYRFIKSIDINKDTKTLNERYYEANVDGFKEGFQKALELIGNKKFSEDDMLSFGRICTNDAHAPSDKRSKTWTELLNKYTQSLQQTEWDVEIETILIQSSIEGKPIWEPKLDAAGCLILKRKS